MKKRHSCGYNLWVSERWNGLENVPVYYDAIQDDGDEETCTPGELWYCPHCEEVIFKEDFSEE